MTGNKLKTLILGAVAALGLTAVGGDFVKDPTPVVSPIPEKIDEAANTISFGDVPPHTATVDSNGVITLSVAEKTYTIDPLKVESDKAESTKTKSDLLIVETKEDGALLKEVWGKNTEIEIKNSKDTFSKVVTFTQDDFKALAADTKYIEVKFEITGFEIPDGIYTNRIEIQPHVWLEKGKAWDSSGGDPNQNYTDVSIEIIGSTLIKRIPIEWFKTATFPVYTDAVFTFGTKELVDGGSMGHAEVLKLDTDTSVFCWVDDADATAEGECVAATVSGTDLTFGSVVEFTPDIGSASNLGLGTCSAGTNRFVTVYRKDAAEDWLYARVGSSTGSTINGFGTELNATTSTSTSPACTYVSTDTIIIATGMQGNFFDVQACSINADYSLTCGSPKRAHPATGNTPNDTSCAAVNTNRFLCWHSVNANFSAYTLGSVSGTTVTIIATSSTALGANTVVGGGNQLISPSSDTFAVTWGKGTSPIFAILTLGTTSASGFTLGSSATVTATTTASGITRALIAMDADSAALLVQYGATDAVNTYTAVIPVEMNFSTLTFSTSTQEQVDTSTDPGSMHGIQISACKYAFAFEDDNDTSDLFAIIGDTAGCGGSEESPKDEFQMIFSQAEVPFIHTLIAPPRKFYQVNDKIDV